MALLGKVKGVTIVGLGLFLNSLGLLLNTSKLAGETSEFFTGFCTGIGMTFIIAGAIKVRQEIKEKKKND